MQIEELKRWHWIAAGILVGLAFAYVWSGIEPPSVRNASVNEFLRDITLTDPQTKKPIVQNIVIHAPEPNFESDALRQRVERLETEATAAEQAAQNPPGDVPDPAAFVQQKQSEAKAARDAADAARRQLTNARVNRVTYRKWMKDAKSGQRVLVDRQFIAEVPFVPGNARGADIDPNLTIEKYLQQMQTRHDHLRFSRGWWTSTPATYAICTVASVLVIGVLWPTLLNVMIGAGYGRPPRPKPEYDLSRFKGDSSSKDPVPAKPRATAEDQQRLRDMTEKLESNLGGFGQVQPQAQTDAVQPQPDAIRKLDGGPLELTPLTKPQDEDEIEVKGEYYPVLIHHKKAADDSKRDK